MQELNIYLAGIDDISELMRIDKGYAIPVIVHDGLFYYYVEVYNCKAFEDYITININNDGYPISIPNLIISNNCSNSEIKNTIYYNYKSLYFQFIKHVNLINLNSCIAGKKYFLETLIIGEENEVCRNIIEYNNNIFNVEIVKYKKNIVNNINLDAICNVHDDIELIKSIQNEMDRMGYLEYFKPHYYLAITQMLRL
jgi:hypothetical protein